MSSRRFTAQCLRASTEKDSTQDAAALRDFRPVYVRFGSLASDLYAAGGRGMSASRRKRTNCGAFRYVRFVPKADSCSAEVAQPASPRPPCQR